MESLDDLFPVWSSLCPTAIVSQLTWVSSPWTWHRYFSSAGPGSVLPAGWSHTRRQWRRRHNHAAGLHTGWGPRPPPCCAFQCLSEAPAGQGHRLYLTVTRQQMGDTEPYHQRANARLVLGRHFSSSFVKSSKLKGMRKPNQKYAGYVSNVEVQTK